MSTLPEHPCNENELKLDAVLTTETNPEGGEAEVSLSRRRICLRNVMLELILCLIYAEGGELDHRYDNWGCSSPINMLNWDEQEFSFQFCNFAMSFSVYSACRSVLSLNTFKLHKI